MKLCVCPQCVSQDDKKKIKDADDEARGETKGRLAPMSSDAQRDADQREDNARQGERKAFVNFGSAGSAHLRIFVVQLFQKLLEREHRSARPPFFLFVKLVQTNRKGPFRDTDTVPDSVEIPWIVLIALLVARGDKMHENALVRQIGFE